MNQSNSTERDIIDIVVIGDMGVGKSSLCTSFAMNQMTSVDPHLDEVYTRQDELNGRQYLLNIHEVTGQDEFNRDAAYEKADGYIIVFDVADRLSFESVMKYHESLWNVLSGIEGCDTERPVVVFGNKNDLDRQVGVSEGKNICKLFGIYNSYSDGAVATTSNINEPFHIIIEFVRKKRGIETVKPKSGCSCDIL